MKYIKVYESYRSYNLISLGEYEDYIWEIPLGSNPKLRNPILTLSYIEQEMILDLFKSKYTVIESLDNTLSEENVVFIGFNKVDVDVSCWINIKLVKIYPRTKKWINGRRKVLLNDHVFISKVGDEWFFVSGVTGLRNYNKVDYSEEFAKCDQIGGLIEYLKSRYIS